MEAGGESQGDEFEPVDPFDSDSDGESDGGEAEAVEAPVDLASLGLMKASDLLPPEAEESEDDIPPTPEEADLQSLPLAERERIKLAKMTPEQRERYDAASAEIAASPGVRIAAASEAHHVEKMEAYRVEFLKEMKKKKEKG